MLEASTTLGRRIVNVEPQPGSRPRDRCAPEERDEVSAGHSMTSFTGRSEVYDQPCCMLVWLRGKRSIGRSAAVKAALSDVQAGFGLGGNVRKGEHGTKVYFVKQLQVRDKARTMKPSTRLVPMMREYTVFNVDQCDNLPDSINTGKPIRVRNPDTRDELADAFLHSTGADIREGHGEAYYVPSRDFISMPAFAGFKGADHFYNVAFHELTHWTGHKSRLDRDLKNRFGSRDYAAEELIAELGAAFLCAEFGFDGDVRNAGYIATWIELLKADKRAFFTACSQAPRRRTIFAAWPLPSPPQRQREVTARCVPCERCALFCHDASRASVRKMAELRTVPRRNRMTCMGNPHLKLVTPAIAKTNSHAAAGQE